MVDASGGKSKQKSTPLTPGSIDPSFALQAGLFGQPVSLNPTRSIFQLGSFDPNIQNTRFFQSVNPLVKPLFSAENPLDLTSLLDAVTSVPGTAPANLFGGLEEATETGFRTDLDPIVAQSLRLFENELVPQIQQGFANQGLGPFSSDLGVALSRSGADIATNLGALQAQADEAAADRRLNALLASPDLALGIAGLEQSLDPSTNMLNLIQILSGLPVQPILQQFSKARQAQGGAGISGQGVASAAGAF